MNANSSGSFITDFSCIWLTNSSLVWRGFMFRPWYSLYTFIKRYTLHFLGKRKWLWLNATVYQISLIKSFITWLKICKLMNLLKIISAILRICLIPCELTSLISRSELASDKTSGSPLGFLNVPVFGQRIKAAGTNSSVNSPYELSSLIATSEFNPSFWKFAFIFQSCFFVIISDLESDKTMGSPIILEVCFHQPFPCYHILCYN